MSYDPCDSRIGGFTENDGTIDFYLRVKSLVTSKSIILDLGAGRAAWYDDDKCTTRKDIRLLKGKVKSVIAADVDDAVFENKSSDQQILIKAGKLDIKPNSIDLIIADYVLEHIDNPKEFYNQINNTLKSGGWFCARTPHKWSYVALVGTIVKNAFHAKFLKYIQPNRKEIDVFPTHYKLNSFSDISTTFCGWENFTFLYRAEPAYYFGNKHVFTLQLWLHKFLPTFTYGNLFIFLRKP